MSIRSKEFLLAASKRPLARQLQDIFGFSTHDIKAGKRPSVKTHARVDIVSERLCRDVLDYIGRDLAQHKGCDVIDINPGACLWSKHIHDLLQPRCHLLMEPEQRYYDPFIKPLLDAPGSKFRFSPLPGTHPYRYWSSYSDTFNGNLLPKRNPLPEGDPSLRQLNRTLLVTGNFHRMYAGFTATGADPYKHSHLALGHLVQAGLTNDLFHRYGLVRMLCWIPEACRGDVLPYALPVQSIQNSWVELAAEITEVAGPDEHELFDQTASSIRNRYRPYVLDNLSAIQAREKTKAAGKKIPPHRQLSRYKSAKMTAELKQHMDRLIIKSDDETVVSVKDMTKAVNEHARNTNKYVLTKWTLSTSARESLKAKHKSFMEAGFYEPSSDLALGNRLADFMELSARQVQLEGTFSRMIDKMDQTKQGEVKGILLSSADDIRKGLLGTGSSAYTAPYERARLMFDEFRTFSQNPPLLRMDRRPYEALKVDDDEVFPRIPSMLLQIDPTSASFATDFLDKRQGARIMREFCNTFGTRRAVGVAQALSGFAADCAEDLVPQAPSLYDASKAGRLADEDLKVATVTREMRRELISAYFEWPFRAQDSDVKSYTSPDMSGEGEVASADAEEDVASSDAEGRDAKDKENS